LLRKRAPSVQTLESRIAEYPDDLLARYQLNAVRLVTDDYPGAMAELLEIVRRDRGFQDGVGRRGLLAIFALLGSDRGRAPLSGAVAGGTALNEFGRAPGFLHAARYFLVGIAPRVMF
jgi:hypothetical protein